MNENIGAQRDHGGLPAPLSLSIFAFVYSGADRSQFSYWLGSVLGAVSFVNIQQSHNVATVLRDQKRLREITATLID
jgi:hypothetical protein